jgi:hypothetical protein
MKTKHANASPGLSALVLFLFAHVVFAVILVNYMLPRVTCTAMARLEEQVKQILLLNFSDFLFTGIRTSKISA